MRIDLALLTRLNACVEQRDAFVAAFPDGLDVTGEPDANVIARIVEAELDVDWMCEMVLTSTAYAAYLEAAAPAYAAYLEAAAPARAAYLEAAAPARAAYLEATATDYAAYLEATATAAWRIFANLDNIQPEYVR